MTCIIGLVAGPDVYMAADTAGTAGWLQMDLANGKMFTYEDYLVGFTCSYRMGQVLQYNTAWPKYTEDKGDLFPFMVREVVPAVRSAMKAAGFAEITEGRERIDNQAQCALVGIRGRLFHLSGNYQIDENLVGIDSVGCGGVLALGSMLTLKKTAPNATPRKRLALAMAVTMEANAGVGGRVEIQRAPRPKKGSK